MARTRPDLYQLDTTGSVEGDVIKIVGGVPEWSADILTNAKFQDQEVPSGAVNGSNVTFVLASAAVAPQQAHLYLDGIRLMEGAGNDYILDVDRRTITMDYAPASGQNFFCDYRHA